jgi:hypothetical protein
VDDFRQMASDDTVALARAAAEAIRGLNHATRCDAGLGQPPAAYDVTGALSLAASRPGQLLTQITGYQDRSLQAGRPGHDLGEDPALDINGAGVFPGDAPLSAAALAGDLSQAQEQLAHASGCPARRNPQDQA